MGGSSGFQAVDVHACQLLKNVGREGHKQFCQSHDIGNRCRYSLVEHRNLTPVLRMAHDRNSDSRCFEEFRSPYNAVYRLWTRAVDSYGYCQELAGVIEFLQAVDPDRP